MRKAFCLAATLAMALGALSCSSGDVSSKMNFYHGQKIPDQFFKVVSYSAEEVVFEILVDFKSIQMYHVLLDASGKPVAEGWFPTVKIGSGYTLSMKLKKGAPLQEGKAYRLCIGRSSPEEVFVTSSSYRCLADYEFILGKN